MKDLGRPAYFSKVRALISLLNLWFINKPDGEIITLGVCSDGKLFLNDVIWNLFT